METRKLLMPTLGAAMVRSNLKLDVRPVNLETVRELLDGEGWQCAVVGQSYAALLLKAIDADMPISRSRIKLAPGDLVILVSAGRYVCPDRKYSVRDLDELAETLSFAVVRVG